MIVTILATLTLITFLTALSISEYEFSTTKYVFQGITASMLIASLIISAVVAIASAQTKFLQEHSIPLSTHPISKHTLSSNQDHIFTLEDGTTYTVPDSDLNTSYTTHPSNTLTIRQGVVDMNPFLPVRYTVEEEKFYEFTPPHS